VPILPAKIRASQSCSTSGLKPGICVRPVNARVMPMVMPRRMNSDARVTMNDGKPVRMTTMPLM